MWTPDDRALVGDYGSGQALSDEQYPVARAAHSGRQARWPSADDGHAAPAGRAVLPGAHWLPVAASATPSGIPAVATMYGYMRAFLRDGVWESIRHQFVVMLREGAGREASPTAAIIDTQSVKTTESGGPRGWDAAKQVKGRKRHVAVDTTGCCSACSCMRPTSRTRTAWANC